MGSKNRIPRTRYFFISSNFLLLQKYRVKGGWAMFWVLILFFGKFIKPFKKFFRCNIEILAQSYQGCKGNVPFSLFNPSYMKISLMKTLELGQAFLQPKFLCSGCKPG